MSKLLIERLEMDSLTRRSWIRLAGFGAAAAGLMRSRAVGGAQDGHTPAMQHAAHTMGPVGSADLSRFNPSN